MRQYCPTLAVAFSALLLVTVPAGAANLIIGFGTASCGSWTEGQKQKERLADAQQQWLLGYVSAFNLQSSVDYLKGTDAPGLLSWISQYCAQNPLDTIQVAADALVIEVRRRAVRPDARNRTK